MRDSSLNNPKAIYWSLGALVLFAFSLRVLAIAQFADQVWSYHYLSKNILNGYGFKDWGGGPHLVFPPFPSYFYAVLSKISGLSILAASRLGNSIVGSLLILPVFGLTRRIAGYPASFAVATALALFPFLIINGSQAHTDVLLTTFILTGAWLTIVIIQDNPRWAYPLHGFVMGLAYLTKPDGMMFFALFIGVIIASRGRFIFISKSLLSRIFLAILCFSLFALPYIYYLSINLGKLSLTGKQPYVIAAANAVHKGNWDQEYYALNHDKTARIIKDYRKTSLIKYIQDNPEKMGKVYTAGLIRLKKFIFTPLVNSFGLLAVLLVGLLLYTEKGYFSRNSILWLSILLGIFSGYFYFSNPPPLDFDLLFKLTTVLGILFVLALANQNLGKALIVFALFVPIAFLPISLIVPRYAYAYIIPTIIILFAGLIFLGEFIREKTKGSGIYSTAVHWTKLSLVALLCGILFQSTETNSFISRLFAKGRLIDKYQSVSKENTFHAEVGRWMQKHLPPGSKIMARKLFFTYFADVETVQLPAGSYDDVLHYARYKKAGYFLFSRHEKRSARAFSSLWEGQYNPEDFELIKTFDNGNGEKVFIYKILH